MEIVYPWIVGPVPWEQDKDSRHKWAATFLADKDVPAFVFSAPSPKTIERIDFFIQQFCTKHRKWILSFSDSTTYMRELEFYIMGTFVLTTGLAAQVVGPDRLVQFAFERSDNLEFGLDDEFQAAQLLIIPYFDPLYPGYQKAIPKIAALLLDRKLNKRPYMVNLYEREVNNMSGRKTAEGVHKLSDYFGEQAYDLFTDSLTKYVVIPREENV